jgi:hypothetical protein
MSSQHDALEEEARKSSSSGVKVPPENSSNVTANQQINLLREVKYNEEGDEDKDDISSIDEEAISSILLDSNILTNQLCYNASILSSIHHPHGTDQDRSILNTSYSTVRKSSLVTIVYWMVLYFATAVGIIMNTRGLEEKVVAIIGGASKFVAAVLVFIVSAKIPQWVSSFVCIHWCFVDNVCVDGWMDGLYHSNKIICMSFIQLICSQPHSSVYTTKDPSS